MFFAHRIDALNKLIETMPIKELKQEDWIVLAISEGGVFFADQIAMEIDAKVDYLFTEPIAAPNNKDCIVGMVSETEEIVINYELINSFGITLDYMYGEAKRKYEENILPYLYKYRKGKHLIDIKDKKVLLVDQGADTGITLMTSLKTIFTKDVSRVVVAAPILPESIAIELESIVDEVYVVHQVQNYVKLETYFTELSKFDMQIYGDFRSKST